MYQYLRLAYIWGRNFVHVEKLFNNGSAVRKIMYTTDVVESVNSNFKKITKDNVFPNKNSLLKLLYLRILELYKNS